MAGSIGVMSITPFDSGGALDLAELERHLVRFLPHRLSVYVCSQGSGEGLSLTLDEKEAVYRTAVRVLGGRREVVGAGIGLSGDTDTALGQVERLGGTGVDAVQVFPPRTGALRPRDREIERYFAEVVGASGCPVVLGENTTLVGYELGPRLIQRLLDQHTEIVGLSYTAPGSLGQLIGLVETLRERVPVRTGWLHHLPSMAAVGGSGVLCFDPNVVPGLAEAAWDALCNGSGDAISLLGELYAVNAVLSRWGNPASIKAALALRGLPAGHLRRPLLGFEAEDQARFATDLERVGGTLDRWT